MDVEKNTPARMHHTMYGNSTVRLLFLKKTKSDECFKEMPAV
jgi:hypothetical protein